MITIEKLHARLSQLQFNVYGWGRTEANELIHILLPDEEIYDLVNGFYEGGFALLVGTNHRILLIDKKPLNYLTVEDFRFDMISEIDYNSRIFWSNMCVSTGTKNLQFTSFNRDRLRKLTDHVQHRMAEVKSITNSHREDQKQHLRSINQRLQVYLDQQQKQMNELLGKKSGENDTTSNTFDSEHRVSNYLYAQSLLNQHPTTRNQADQEALQFATNIQQGNGSSTFSEDEFRRDLYEAGRREIFKQATTQDSVNKDATPIDGAVSVEIDPKKVACSKLSSIWRSRLKNQTPPSANAIR